MIKGFCLAAAACDPTSACVPQGALRRAVTKWASAMPCASALAARPITKSATARVIAKPAAGRRAAAASASAREQPSADAASRSPPGYEAGGRWCRRGAVDANDGLPAGARDEGFHTEAVQVD